MEAWKLHYRALGRGPNTVGEQIFACEDDFTLALQVAYNNFGTGLTATLPDGTVLTGDALRQRFPPEQD